MGYGDHPTGVNENRTVYERYNIQDVPEPERSPLMLFDSYSVIVFLAEFD